MARIVEGPQVNGQVVSKQTGAPLSGVTVTPSSTVYTDREMTLPVTTVTTNGSGRFSFYAPPGTFTFTLSDPNAAPVEPVEVLSHDEGGGARESSTYATVRVLGTPMVAAPQVDRIALDYPRFDLGAGAAKIVMGRQQAWGLRDANNDTIIATVDVPPHWTSVNVDLEWSVNVSSTGNVTVRFDCAPADAGVNLNAAFTTVGTAFVKTIPAQYVKQIDALATAVAVDATKPWCVRVMRLGNDAGDTFTSTLGVLRVILKNANA